MRWFAVTGWVLAALFALLWVASGPCAGPVLRDPQADLLRDRVERLEDDLAMSRGEVPPGGASEHPPLVTPRGPATARQMPASVTVKVVSASGLPDRDKLGKADPYVVVAFDGEERITPALKGTLSPVWNYSCEFRFAAGQSLTFTVYDRDVLKPDIVGEASLALDPADPGRRSLRLSGGGTLVVDVSFPE
jgi:hypothetical protein